MDEDVKEANGLQTKSLVTTDPADAKNHIDDDDDDGDSYTESSSLLPPRRGEMSRNTENVRRKVQWNDKNGNKLAEILVFEPSDGSDSDEEDLEDCVCTIM